MTQRWRTTCIPALRREMVWAETYNREMGDIFAIQDEIAKAVSLS